MLVEAGVPVCRAVQKPGQFIVTLPQAYHAGFSHGFNSAEAVNFMTDDWIPYAKAAARRYRSLGKEPVIDLDKILVAASQDNYSPAIHMELCKAVSGQLRQRVVLRERLGCADVLMDDEMRARAMGRSPPCALCGRICHFSFVAHTSADVTAAGAAGNDESASAMEWSKDLQVACLHHAEQLKDVTERVEPLRHYMRYDDKMLKELCRHAAECATQDSHRAAAAKRAAEAAEGLLQPPNDGPPLPVAVAKALDKALDRPAGAQAKKKKK